MLLEPLTESDVFTGLRDRLRRGDGEDLRAHARVLERAMQVGPDDPISARAVRTEDDGAAGACGDLTLSTNAACCTIGREIAGCDGAATLSAITGKGPLAARQAPLKSRPSGPTGPCRSGRAIVQPS